MTIHDDAIFPEPLSWGSSSGPGFSTAVHVTASGLESRVSKWSAARNRFEVNLRDVPQDDMSAIRRFMLARRGAAIGFRFRDPFDYTSSQTGYVKDDGIPIPTGPATDQLIGTGDGNRVSFVLTKRYADPSGNPDHDYIRIISRPIIGTVKLAVGGVEKFEGTDYIVSHSTGGVVFQPTSIPGNALEVRADYQFHTPCRFSEGVDEFMSQAVDGYQATSSRLNLVEVLDIDPDAGVYLERPNDYPAGGVSLSSVNVAVGLIEMRNGRLQEFNPPQALTLDLPQTSNPAFDYKGGPVLTILNRSGIFTITVRDAFDAGGTRTVVVISPGQLAELWLGVDAAFLPRWISR